MAWPLRRRVFSRSESRLLRWFTPRRWRLLSSQLAVIRVWFSQYITYAANYIAAGRPLPAIIIHSAIVTGRRRAFLASSRVNVSNVSRIDHIGNRRLSRIFPTCTSCFPRRADSDWSNGESGSIFESNESDVHVLWRNLWFVASRGRAMRRLMLIRLGNIIAAR